MLHLHSNLSQHLALMAGFNNTIYSSGG